MTNTYKLTLALILGAVFATLFILMQKPWEAKANVQAGQEYYATSTDTQTLWRNYNVIQGQEGKAIVGVPSTRTATSAPTVLGSLIITTTGTSPMCFHDATSTRTNAEWATSTIACFAASPTVGEYRFDVQLQKGLLVEFTGSDSATSRASTTITFR